MNPAALFFLLILIGDRELIPSLSLPLWEGEGLHLELVYSPEGEGLALGEGWYLRGTDRQAGNYRFEAKPGEVILFYGDTPLRRFVFAGGAYAVQDGRGHLLYGGETGPPTPLFSLSERRRSSSSFPESDRAPED